MDDCLHHGMCYLADTVDLGIRLYATPEDDEKLTIDLPFDADHSNGVATSKSTSGYLSFVAGPKSRGCVDWGAKYQTATAVSTADAETGACRDGTCRRISPRVLQKLDLSG